MQDCIPLAVRRRIRSAKRRVADLTAGVRFARRAATDRLRGFKVASYELPLRCYPGQESRFAAKRQNLGLALAAIDGVVLQPGELLSFWDRVGRPTRRAGYAAAAALKRGALVEDIGGAICLASTVIYNVGLLSGLAVVERYCHSVDTYRADRYFEPGRDAAVEFPYRDLRLRNDLQSALLLRASASDDVVRGEIWSELDLKIAVDITVSPMETIKKDEFRVRTERLTSQNGTRRREDLGWSAYRIPQSQRA